MKIGNLKKSSIRKYFYGPRKIYHAEVIGWLQQKVQAQSQRIRDNIYFNFGKLASALECGDAGLHFRLRVGLARFLLDQRPKDVHVAMRISDKINGTYGLPVIDRLRTLHRKLRPCPDGK